MAQEGYQPSPEELEKAEQMDKEMTVEKLYINFDLRDSKLVEENLAELQAREKDTSRTISKMEGERALFRMLKIEQGENKLLQAFIGSVEVFRRGIEILEKQLRLNTHENQLKSYGLPGLEGRMQRGLDPAGMLAVEETRVNIESLTKEIGVDMAALDELTKALHVGAIWEKADDLAKGEKPEVRAWLLLAAECREVNDHDLWPEEYLDDVDRIDSELQRGAGNAEETVSKAVEWMTVTAKEKFTKKEGVPFSEEDAFLYMAIAGERFGVCKAGDLYFAGAKELDYSILEAQGLTAVQREDRGRMATFYQRDGKDLVKQLYPGLAIVFGDEELALMLAKSAEKSA